MWVSQPDNLFYLSGCEGLEGYLLISQQKAVMVTDFRYIEQAQRQSPDCEIFRISGKMADWLPRAVFRIAIFRIWDLKAAIWRSASLNRSKIFSKPPALKWLPQNGLIEGIRIVKDKPKLKKLYRRPKSPMRFTTMLRRYCVPA